ncbi:MAG TPA: MFS transporter [Sphingobium sp.]|nr:MFS transporter [Allosphingosinicella sp.]HKT75316.1 MFS transporter [Sphingobium sp.]
MVIYTLVMGVTYSIYGLFVVPVAEEYGLPRADANSGLIILNVGVALLSPFLGRVLDLVAARTIMVVSSVAFMTGYTMLSLSTSLWIAVGIYALVLPFAVKGTGTLTAPLLVARWFIAQRGRAMTLSQLGYSGGGLLLPPIIGYLIEAYGWRTASLASGVGAGVVLLFIALGIRERPRPDERESPALPAVDHAPDGSADAGSEATTASQPLSLTSILACPQFLAISLGGGLASAAGLT